MTIFTTHAYKKQLINQQIRLKMSNVTNVTPHSLKQGTEI